MTPPIIVSTAPECAFYRTEGDAEWRAGSAGLGSSNQAERNHGGFTHALTSLVSVRVWLSG